MVLLVTSKARCVLETLEPRVKTELDTDRVKGPCTTVQALLELKHLNVSLVNRKLPAGSVPLFDPSGTTLMAVPEELDRGETAVCWQSFILMLPVRATLLFTWTKPTKVQPEAGMPLKLQGRPVTSTLIEPMLAPSESSSQFHDSGSPGGPKDVPQKVAPFTDSKLTLSRPQPGVLPGMLCSAPLKFSTTRLVVRTWKCWTSGLTVRQSP